MTPFSVDDVFYDYACGDECGAAVMVRQNESAAGWCWLDVARKWRCPKCRHDLEQANTSPLSKGPDHAAV